MPVLNIEQLGTKGDRIYPGQPFPKDQLEKLDMMSSTSDENDSKQKHKVKDVIKLINVIQPTKAQQKKRNLKIFDEYEIPLGDRQKKRLLDSLNIFTIRNKFEALNSEFFYDAQGKLL